MVQKQKRKNKKPGTQPLILFQLSEEARSFYQRLFAEIFGKEITPKQLSRLIAQILADYRTVKQDLGQGERGFDFNVAALQRKASEQPQKAEGESTVYIKPPSRAKTSRREGDDEL